MISKAFIVLGMGRSATSLIGKGLNLSGVDIGKKLLGKKKGNVWGHWEDLEFTRLNTKILSACGGSWYKPPGEKIILKKGKIFEDEIKNLIDRRKQKPLWGFKDPRTTLTIKLYLPYLNNIDVHFICCFRSLSQVAKSLNRRDGSNIKESINVAKIYNKRLLSFMAWWLNRE